MIVAPSPSDSPGRPLAADISTDTSSPAYVAAAAPPPDSTASVPPQPKSSTRDAALKFKTFWEMGELKGDEGKESSYCGIALGKTSWFGIFLLFIPAYAIIIAFYGLIPPGSDDRDNRGDLANWLVFVLLVNPISWGFVNWLNYSIYLSLASTHRPLRNGLWLFGVTYLVQVAWLLPVVAGVGLFRFLGLACLFVSALLLMGAIGTHLYVLRRRRHKKELSDKSTPQHLPPTAKQATKSLKGYMIVVTLLFIELLFLTAYIYAFRYLTSGVRSVLPVAVSLVMFILRKSALPATTMIPREAAMLIAGFWFQNLADVFSLFAYPQLRNFTGATYVVIFLTNAAGHIYSLIFITRPWFWFRVWIKDKLKSVFCCRCPIPPKPKPDETFIEDDRGIGLNRGGYIRRQIRFMFWRVVSQILAQVFFLIMAPVLAWGINERYYPFHEYSRSAIYNALYFSAFMLVWTVLIAAVELFVTITWYRDQLKLVMTGVWRASRSRTFCAFIVMMFSHNAIFAMIILYYPMFIWYGFRKGDGGRY